MRELIMDFKVQKTTDMTQELVKRLGKLYYDSDVIEINEGDIDLVDMSTYHTKTIERYIEKDRSFLITGYVKNQLAATTFMLNIENSPFLENNKQVTRKLKEEKIPIRDICVPSYNFVVKKFRGNNLGIQIDAKSREVAIENGYKHIIYFGSMNKEIFDYYLKKFPLSEKKRFLGVQDFNGREILIETIV